ncbi:MAG: sulfatase-like hydrolase/transferase [Planctomycetota bacterium]
MTAWSVRGWLVVGLGLLASGGVVRAAPNVVLIVADDLGYNEVGFNGNTAIPTPRIDAIASAGVVFTQAYANAPICAPSRAGLLLGDYPHRFGFEENPSSANVGLPPDEPNLLRAFHDLGYRVGVFGKWHVGRGFGINTPTDVGADEFFGLLTGIRGYFPGEPNINRQMYRNTTNVEAVWGSEGDPALYDPVRGRYITDALGEETAAFVGDALDAGEAFFALLSFTAPHAPIEAKASDLALVPAAFDGPPELAASIIAMDRAVGMVLDAIAARGASEQTIVVFANDNGGAGPNVIDQDNAPLNGFKRSMLEGGIRVPMAIDAPGVAPLTVDAPVSVMDLAPTLVALAGGVWGGGGSGEDLSGLLAGGPAPSRDALFWRADDLWALRVGDEKLVVSDAGAAPALFDLGADPGESIDLLGESPAAVDALVARFTRWETSVDRIRWKPQTNILQFDGYRFDLASGSSAWGDSFAWINATGAASATLAGRESFADTRLFFPLSESGYTLTNDLTRATGLAFMLNALTLEGSLAAAPGGAHVFDGLGLVFTASRSGVPARLAHEASWPAGGAAVRVAMPITVIDALELAGDGSGELVIEGGMQPLDTPALLTKLGASTFRLLGDVRPGGDVRVEAGRLAVGGSFAEATLEAGAIRVLPGATLEIAGDGSVTGGSLVLDGSDLDLRTAPGVLPAPLELTGTLETGPSARVLLPGPAFAGERRVIARAGSFAIGDGLELVPSAGALRWVGEVVGDRFESVAACSADLGAPFGSLDFFDVLEFLARFDASDPSADLAEPIGMFDFFDVLEYFALFDACAG